MTTSPPVHYPRARSLQAPDTSAGYTPGQDPVLFCPSTKTLEAAPIPGATERVFRCILADGHDPSANHRNNGLHWTTAEQDEPEA
jgi:hypothetical protein